MKTAADLMAFLSDALDQLIDEHGWSPPFHLAIVASNGAAAGGTYVAGEDCLEFVSQYGNGCEFALPINIMFVSSEGDAARVLISGAGPKLSLIH